MRALVLILLAAGVVESRAQQNEETITRTLKFARTEDRALLVDNIAGPIRVTATDGDAVEVKAVRTNKARSEEELRTALKEVQLELRERGNRIEIVAETPWGSRWGSHEWWDQDCGYEVRFDIEIRVPRDVDVYLRTVGSGDIEVNGISGSFDIRNVNGSVTLLDVAGSGRASTVNGSVEVRFRENPRKACSFRTVNGTIRAAFQDPLAADLYLKTFNGDAYTDFDVVALAEPLQTARKRNGKTVYRYSDHSVVRAGAGGPRLLFDTLNGAISIVKAGQAGSL